MNAATATDFTDLTTAAWAAAPPMAVERLAGSLGVSVSSLNRLDIGWLGNRRAWCFPMRDADGKVLGVRLRYPNNRKLSVKGGKEGLFIPVGIDTHGLLLIAEGPTDTAALLDFGILGSRSPVMHGRRQAAGRVRAHTEALRRGDRGRHRRARPTRRGNLGGRVGRLRGIGANHRAALGRERCAGVAAKRGDGGRRATGNRRGPDSQTHGARAATDATGGAIMDDKQGLTIERGRLKNGKAKYTATLAGQTLHVARIDASEPEDRAAFAAAVAKDRPGIDSTAIEVELLQAAGGDEENEKEASQSTKLVGLAESKLPRAVAHPRQRCLRDNAWNWKEHLGTSSHSQQGF